MLYFKLREWQKRIVDEYSSRKAFGLFLDMGLGKTPTSLAFAEQNICTKVLCITINPKATETYEDEGWWWWSQQSSLEYTYLDKYAKDFKKDRSEFFLINYERLHKTRRRDKTTRKAPPIEMRDDVRHFIESCKGHNLAIIVDESHELKSLNSVQSKVFNQILKLANRKADNTFLYLLSGTPFTSGYIDLYSQLKLLGFPENKGFFMDMFCERGQVPGLLGWQQPIVGYKNIDLLYKLIHLYAVTIKSEMVVTLPEKVFIDHISSMSEDFKIFIRDTAKPIDIQSTIDRHLLSVSKRFDGESKVNNPFFRNMAWPELDWLAETSGQFWLRARELSIGFQGNASKSIWYDRRRIRQLKRFLTYNPGNYVMFYNYTPELTELYEICEELGYNIDVYCGEIKSLTFYNKYRAQTPEQRLTNTKNIIISNFASGSTGMNWQAYNHCIMFSLPVFSHFQQAHKRVHRDGSTEIVFYHLFFQNNWLDLGMKKSIEEGVEYDTRLFESDLTRTKALLDAS